MSRTTHHALQGLWDVFSSHAAGADTAVVTPNRFLTFEQLSDHAERIARTFAVPEGSVVALSLGNSLEFVAALLGLARRGSVVALVSHRFGASELAEIMDKGRPVGIVTTTDLASGLEARLPYSLTRSTCYAVHRELCLLRPNRR
jgi:acyl-CoA synthetase (AMP-forming)/AMP-acid ligase II